MNEKKKFAYIVTLFLITAFFLMIVFFIKTNSRKGGTIKDVNLDLTVSVEEGTVTNAYEVVEIPITQEGTYQFELAWDVFEPGYITGCAIRDSKGEVISAFSAAQISGYSNQVVLSSGKSTVEFYFLANAEDYRQFAKTYQIFYNDKELEEYIKMLDFETFTKNGDWSMTLSVETYEVLSSSAVSQLLTLLAGLLSIALLFLIFAGDKEPENTLKERVGSIGVRYAIFSMTVIVFQIIFAALLKTYAPNFMNALGGNVDFLLVILSVDVVGFMIIYRVSKNITKERLPQQKLGFRRFLQFVLMGAGLCGVGSIIGTLVHNVLAKYSGDTGAGIGDLMMSSGMFMRILAVGILAPVFEELIFRKLMIDRLIKYGEFVAILTSGLMFGLFHGNFQQCFYATFLGWLWAYVYVRTGRIRYTIMMHMIINLSSSVITIYLIGKTMEHVSWDMSDVATTIEALTTNPYTLLLVGWRVILGICCLAGIIIFIVFKASGKFRLQMQEGEPSKGEIVKSVLTNKYMWLFYLSCIGMFLIRYMPAFWQ